MKRTFAALAFLILSAMPAAQAKEPINVVMDRAKVMRIAGQAATVIIGNPGIADATMHDRQTIVITGRAVGMTNLVILDPKGEPIADEVVSVEKAQTGLVTIQRAGARASYSCTPHCNAMFEPGDDDTAFTKSMSQIQQRNDFGAKASNGAAPQ